MLRVFDDSACQLGEGALWHPLRQQLFWFDILGKTLYGRGETGLQRWLFDEHVSAAGWVDRDTLLIASETALLRFDLASGRSQVLLALEADNPQTRSNDGRADPWGGFWIGTMGKQAEPGAGAIYRYYRGELRRLFAGISIPNAICFAPDRSCAYYSDTVERIIWRQPLEPVDGWPRGEPEVFVDLREEGLNPDGAVCDARGNLWNAQWGASRVAQYGPDGRFISATEVPTEQPSCPAFGGPELSTLFVTSARQGLTTAQLSQQPAGQTFCAELSIKGLPEYRVVLD